ncbi:MAG: FecR family protein [Gammaproteobacteria bacterium]
MTNEHDTVIDTAAGFHARVASGEMTADDWRELEDWLDRDDEHRRVFESMGQMSDAMSSLGSAAGRRVLDEVAPELSAELDEIRAEANAANDEAATGGWSARTWALAASLLIALAIPVAYFVGGDDAPVPSAYEAAIGERRTIDLDDGSSLSLGADSRTTVTMSARERELVLRHGEIYLDVAQDEARPFRVVVGDHAITVVGTAFNIRWRDEPARVTVHDGLVAVGAANGNAGLQQDFALRAGQRIVLERDATPVDLSAEELARESAWRDGWLYFDDVRLDAVVDELNLYVDKRIVIADGKAASLRVGGSFNVDDSKPLLAALESLLPVRISETSERIVIGYADDG